MTRKAQKRQSVLGNLIYFQFPCQTELCSSVLPSQDLLPGAAYLQWAGLGGMGEGSEPWALDPKSLSRESSRGVPLVEPLSLHRGVDTLQPWETELWKWEDLRHPAIPASNQ